ncbi:MAG: MoaD/ThiS family protein [Desulfosporosinus sp.]|nr:MoaD/ThiS family protein [Desulfosporosinus sp.]
MQVTVKLFADLREGRFEIENTKIADQSRVTDVVQSLNIPPDQVKICLVNGRNAGTDYVVQNGDTVSLFPPVGGG